MKTGRPRNDDKLKIKKLIQKALCNQYALTPKAAEEAFMNEWLENVRARKLSVKDMELLLSYMYDTTKEYEHKQLDYEPVQIIIPDYEIRKDD